MPNSPDQYESHDSYNPHETKNYQNLQIAGATGKAKQLLETHGDLRGHPVWMGIGVNGIYNDEMVLAYINWALQHNAGTFWLVLAHEYPDFSKKIMESVDIRKIITGRLYIASVQFLFEQLSYGHSGYNHALYSLLANQLTRDEGFNQDVGMRNVKSRIDGVFLNHILSEQAGVGIKIGPPTEQGPDQIYTNFIEGKYNTRLRNPRNQGNQGFLYIK